MSVSESKEGKFPVIEIFGPTIQGEGVLAGQRTHFVRFGGCPYRCTWCDTIYAVDPKQIKENAIWLSPEEIFQRLQGFKPSRWVTLSGGDPVMWDLNPLTKLLGPRYWIAVETEGALWKDWLWSCDLVTVSPKPPSSGMADKIRHDVLKEYAGIAPAIKVMKVVVFNDEDLEFARGLHKQYQGFNFYLTPGTTQGLTTDETKHQITNRLRWLSNQVLKYDDLQDVTIIPQLHTLTWGPTRGV